MIYTFAFEWGETWTVTEDDFNWDIEYWCKVMARHIHFFRINMKSVNHEELITTVMITCNNDYVGLVSVSDNYVHVILHGNVEYCWRIEEV